MSTFWSWFIAIGTLGTIAGCWWLIRWTAKVRPGEVPIGEPTGHTYDDRQLSEYNNPMPRWWLWMFYILIVFGLIYLLLYPGLGNWQGLLGWSQERQYEEQMAAAEERYGPIFARYAEQPIPELAEDPEALKVGQRLYATYCSQCHGSDARGAIGYPNLTDDAWLYGGDPQSIKTSILDGRNGNMPALGQALGGDDAVDAVVQYVMSLSGQVEAPADPAGETKFKQVCAGCHMADGTGNPALGAPNLTDDVWLYGGSRGAIRQTLMQGRQGRMPAHEEFLGENKVHVLAAYVYSLSQDGQ